MTTTSRIAAVLMGLLMIITAALPAALPDTEASASPGAVDVITPSMVEMLDEAHAGGVVTMAALRQDTLGDRGHLATGAGVDVALLDTGV